jgi:hypothetical protein
MRLGFPHFRYSKADSPLEFMSLGNFLPEFLFVDADERFPLHSTFPAAA